MEHESEQETPPESAPTDVRCPGCGARIVIATGEATWDGPGDGVPDATEQAEELARLREENAQLLAQLQDANRTTHAGQQVRRAVNRYLRTPTDE